MHIYYYFFFCFKYSSSSLFTCTFYTCIIWFFCFFFFFIRVCISVCPANLQQHFHCNRQRSNSSTEKNERKKIEPRGTNRFMCLMHTSGKRTTKWETHRKWKLFANNFAKSVMVSHKALAIRMFIVLSLRLCLFFISLDLALFVTLSPPISHAQSLVQNAIYVNAKVYAKLRAHVRVFHLFDHVCVCVYEWEGVQHWLFSDIFQLSHIQRFSQNFSLSLLFLHTPRSFWLSVLHTAHKALSLPICVCRVCCFRSCPIWITYSIVWI